MTDVPRGAALRLVVDGPESDRSLEVFAGDATTALWKGTLDAREIKGVIGELRATLQAIHDVAGNALNSTAQRSVQTVDELLYFSLGVGYGLFGEHPGILFDEARKRAPAAFDPSGPARIIEITTPPDFNYPFELLQWQDPPPDLPVDPALRIRSLLGMSAIIRRRFGQVEEASTVADIENNPKLPVTIFRNTSLSATQKETDYLASMKDIVNVYGPWPGSQELPKLATARYIMNPRVGFDGADREPPAAMIHLACHCNTTSAADNLHYINVGGTFGKVLLGDLKKQLMMAVKSHESAPRPLVFLNACGSAAPHIADRSSFTSFLLSKRFLGVIGTLCDISDTVAAHFANVFYEAFLSRKPVGEAMLEARSHLMERHRNPLGLLYTLYGNPDITVSTSRAGQIVPACTAPFRL